jgi:hypothetical protein
MDVLQSPRIDADGIADAAAVIDCGLNLDRLGILEAARQRWLPGVRTDSSCWRHGVDDDVTPDCR